MAGFSIQLAVADLGTTEAFYAGILELPVKRALTAPGAPEHLVMAQGEWEVVFVEEQDVARANPVLEERLGSFPKGVGMTLYVRIADIDGTYDAVVEEDIEVLYPLARRPYGGKEFWCFDPDGYLVVVEENSA